MARELNGPRSTRRRGHSSRAMHGRRSGNKKKKAAQDLSDAAEQIGDLIPRFRLP